MLEGQRESITEEDVQRVLDTVRTWYAQGLKSSNKMYRFVEEEDPKNLRRNLDAAEASKRNAELVAATKGMSSLEAGDYIVNNGAKWGNCIEMTQATLHFCLADEGMNAKMQHAWVADSNVHTFLLVSDGRRVHDHEGLTIKDDFAVADKQGVWVIDCWMNIACRTADYQRLINEKTAKWEEKDKVIARETESETVRDADGKVEVEMPVDFDTARRFGRRLIKSDLQLEPIPLRRLKNAPVPQKRDSDSQPSIKRARVSQAGASVQTRAGPSTGARAAEAMQPTRKAPDAAPGKPHSQSPWRGRR